MHRFKPRRGRSMRRLFRLVVPGLLALGLLASPAQAMHNADAHRKMDLLFTSPNAAINSDLAFWGKHAFIGYYRNDQARGGFRIFDISNPASPDLIRDFQCDGLQNDPIVWDRNGNGVADLMLLAVDRTMDGPACGAARSANHGNPTGWEGVRVFTMSDNPANPFTNIQQVASVYTDCGAHTITLYPGLADQGKLIVYVSSYPLRAGPTCGDPEFQNTANPFDGDPGSPNSPLHGVIQVIEVPLGNPAGAKEIAQQPPISYPGDPDGINDWCERSVTGLNEDGTFADCPGPFEAAAVACHDIVVHMEHQLAGGACAEQGQVWNIDPGTGIPDTANPVMVGDDELSSGGTGNIPGAVDFFHSVMFNNDGDVVNWVDESFGSGCPPSTKWRARSWHPEGTHKTGRMFFSALGGAFLSEFQVGDKRPDPAASAYCSAHMGMAVMGIKRDLLVNAWYTGGVDVIDFSKPRRLKEIAFYDIAGAGPAGSDNWSAYPYTGPLFRRGPGIPVYASDGVHTPDSARGLVVFRTKIEKPGRKARVDHLNPQTMD
jgi:hypothetical protein